MDEFYCSQNKKLTKQFINITQTTLFLICGDKGIGKTVFIQNIIQKQGKKIIEIRDKFDDIDIFVSLKNAIDEFYPVSDVSSLNYSSQIINAFLCMCQKTPNCILYFDDISSYTEEKSLKSIYEIIKMLTLLHSDLKIIILVECSKNILSDHYRKIYYDLCTLTHPDNIFNLEHLDNNCLIQYFKSFFMESVNISDLLILRICKSAFNNLLNIKRFIEYLKDIGIIYFQAGEWISEDIDSQLTYNFFKEYIQPRYDKLDTISKQVLQKASITGYIINVNLLKRPFQVMEPEKKLNNIKRLSHLIEETNKIYNFETTEVYCHVQNQICAEEKAKLHFSLAEYLQKDIPNCWNEKMDLYSYRSKIYDIAYHYLSCCDFDKALYLYNNCIAISKRLQDYDALKKCCKKALSIYELIEPNPYMLQYIHFNLAYSEEKLANFATGATEYNYLLNDIHEYPNLYNYDNIYYHYGYCLRRAGQTQKAYEILDHLRIKFSNINDLNHQKKLVDVLIILIGITDQLGNREQRERYFNWCLNLSQGLDDKIPYYRLLTKSSMYYPSIIAHKYIKEAFEFFNKGTNRIDTAIASYNLGMNEIYCYQINEAKTHIMYSYEIFSTYGGNSISYPLCAMGILDGLNQCYKEAINKFINVINFSTNDFAKITAFVNLSQCYIKLSEYSIAENYINMAEKLLSNNDNDKLVLKRNLYFAKAMLAYIHLNNHTEALKCIRIALDIEKNHLKYRTYNVYLARWIVKLSNSLNSPISDDIKKLAAITLTDYKNACYVQNVMWGNFMFW